MEELPTASPDTYSVKPIARKLLKLRIDNPNLQTPAHQMACDGVSSDPVMLQVLTVEARDRLQRNGCLRFFDCAQNTNRNEGDRSNLM